MQEIWKAVVGFEGLYEVSSVGRVKRLPKVGGKGLVRGAEMSATTDHMGYTRFRLVKDGVVSRPYGHVLVAQAFLEKSGVVVRHKDGTKNNNCVSNLAWGTHKENQADRALHGTGVIGESNPAAALTDAQVLEIRERRARGEKLSALAEEFGVTKTLISKICKGENWTHIGGPIAKPWSVNAKRKVTPEQEDLVMKLRHEGLIWREIGERVGLTLSGAQKVYERKMKK